MSVVLFDAKRSLLEKFTFQLRMISLSSLEHTASRDGIEYALRAFFIKLSSSQQLFRPLPEGWLVGWLKVGASFPMCRGSSSLTVFWVWRGTD